MADHRYTRRGLLGRIGTTASAAAASIGGCLGADRDTPTTTPASIPTARASSATPTPTPVVTPPPLDRQAYASFSPQPDRVGVANGYTLTTTRPARAAAHRSVFGGRYARFSSFWATPIREFPARRYALSVSFQNMFAAVVAVDRETLLEYFEFFKHTRLDPYRGYTLVRVETVNGWRIVAVGTNEFIHTDGDDWRALRSHVEHLIDVRTGAAAAYVHSDDAAAAVTEHLPQGVYTAVTPALDRTTHWLTDYGVVAVGQTLLLEGGRSPTTGRTVFGFDAAADPRAATEEILDVPEQLLAFPLTDPTVTVPGDRTAVVEDAVDPEAAF